MDIDKMVAAIEMDAGVEIPGLKDNLRKMCVRQFAYIHTPADFVQFRSILLRKNSLPPREGDELNEKMGH